MDPVEEHDQLRRAHANGALPKDAADAADDGRVTAEVPPKVSPHVISQFFLLKNDKGPAAKRFYGMTGMKAFDDRPCTEAVHAPNWTHAKNCAFTITVEQVLAPRKDRDAMLTKLANERMKELLQEVQIYKVPVDPTSTGSGPGIVNVAGFVPCRVKDSAEALAAFHAKLPMDENPVFLLAVDEKLMKRIYKVGRTALPREYDPNAHGNVKYRVLNKLEEQAKFDDHFKLATPITVTRGRKSKRPANQVTASSNLNGELRDGQDVPPEGEVAADALAWHACSFPNVKMAKIKTSGKEKLQLVETSKPNEFLLFRIE